MLPETTLEDTAAAKLEHERLTSLINSMADAVLAVDEKACVAVYNGAALNVLDTNNLKTGASVNDIVDIIDKENHRIDMVEMVKGAKQAISSRDYRLKYSDGSSINLYLSIAPVHLGYGAQGERGHVIMLRDITREKSLEEERDEFISVVSHELRTPIAISEGNISNAQFIAEKTNDMNQVRQALKAAHDQIIYLSDMINDLSTLSRAERGKLALEIESVNVHDLVTDLAKNYESEAQAKGLSLFTTIDPNLQILRSSKLYVREILQNFVTNAIKYTEKGHVEIIAKNADQLEAGGVVLAVRDSGIGISKSDQERVYDKFFRSEDFRTRANNGTGLGLYVTMKLARLVHAQISLESELNVGSTFTITIPNIETGNDAKTKTELPAAQSSV